KKKKKTPPAGSLRGGFSGSVVQSCNGIRKIDHGMVIVNESHAELSSRCCGSVRLATLAVIRENLNKSGHSPAWL
ncbi:hypothetical protein, partial [Marinobacter lipolyticus]|uniref:hypothetical protein n=1 Tax=Marinobacter lipolyticus TaxID=209639 RepID=UPI001C91A92D